MSKNMYERERNRIRRAKRLLGTGVGRYTYYSSIGEYWIDYHEGVKTYRKEYAFIYSHLHIESLVPRSMSFEDITYWEAVELGVKDNLVYAKKCTERKSYTLGGGTCLKYFRTVFNRAWRQRNRKYCYKMLRDEEADGIFLEKDKGFWRTVD